MDADTLKSEVARMALRGVCTDWMQWIEEGITIVATVRNYKEKSIFECVECIDQGEWIHMVIRSKPSL